MAHRSPQEIEDMLEKIGLKNVEIAAILNISPNTVSRWKNQKGVPTRTWRQLEDLAKNKGAKEPGLSSFSDEALLRELQRRLRANRRS